MLKGIHPILTADLLSVLASMGHGDTLAIVDANFPAAALAQRLLRLDGVNATAALEAVLSLLPVDDFIPAPASVMAVVGDENSVPPTVQEFQASLDRAEARAVAIAKLSRADFYEAARRAFAIVATGERRLYGNIIVTKGVIRSA